MGSLKETITFRQARLLLDIFASVILESAKAKGIKLRMKELHKEKEKEKI
jgi:hypothetical protein